MAWAYHISVSKGSIVTPPHDGTVATSSEDGWLNNGASKQITVTATPNTPCGWSFVSWDVTIQIEPTGPTLHEIWTDAVHTFSVSEGRFGGTGVVFNCVAYFAFAGSGKILCDENGQKILTALRKIGQRTSECPLLDI